MAHHLKLDGERVDVVVIDRALFVGAKIVALLSEGEELDSVLQISTATVRCRLRHGPRETLVYVTPARDQVRIEQADFSGHCSRKCRPPLRRFVNKGRLSGSAFYGLPHRSAAI